MALATGEALAVDSPLSVQLYKLCFNSSPVIQMMDKKTYMGMLKALLV